MLLAFQEDITMSESLFFLTVSLLFSFEPGNDGSANGGCSIHQSFSQPAFCEGLSPPPLFPLPEETNHTMTDRKKLFV